MELNRPTGWRKGQFIFNFLEWLLTEKKINNNQSYRLADSFHLPDKDFDKYYKEFCKLHEK